MALLIIKGICILILLIFIFLLICCLSYLYEQDYKRHHIKLFIIAVIFIQLHITLGYFLSSLFSNIKVLSLLPLAFGIAITWKSLKTGRIQEFMQVVLFFIGIMFSLILFLFLLQDNIYLQELPHEILKHWKYFFNALTSFF